VKLFCSSFTLHSLVASQLSLASPMKLAVASGPRVEKKMEHAVPLSFRDLLKNQPASIAKPARWVDDNNYRFQFPGTACDFGCFVCARPSSRDAGKSGLYETRLPNSSSVAFAMCDVCRGENDTFIYVMSVVEERSGKISHVLFPPVVCRLFHKPQLAGQGHQHQAHFRGYSARQGSHLEAIKQARSPVNGR